MLLLQLLQLQDDEDTEEKEEEEGARNKELGNNFLLNAPTHEMKQFQTTMSHSSDLQ